jgi:predicted nucleic acid-binding protein
MTLLVLDTNVLSETVRGDAADPGVLAWLLALPVTPVTTVITRAELLSGVAILPLGAPRQRLEQVTLTALAGLGRCLPLTLEAADRYAEIIASRRRSGRPIGSLDALIAAITLEARGTLATRNTKDFEGIGLDVINPWI